MEDHQYAELVTCGAEGLVVYQETYDRDAYTTLHTAGPKKNFNWRLECPERAYAGGFRRIGIGALFGLADWRTEALALAEHLEYLYRHCWKAQFTVSFPRLRPHAGNHRHQADPALSLTDRDLVQLICAFRLTFPQVGIVLSTPRARHPPRPPLPSRRHPHLGRLSYRTRRLHRRGLRGSAPHRERKTRRSRGPRTIQRLFARHPRSSKSTTTGPLRKSPRFSVTRTSTRSGRIGIPPSSTRRSRSLQSAPSLLIDRCPLPPSR